MVQGGGGIQDIWVAFTAGSAANLLCDFQQVIFFFFFNFAVLLSARWGKLT